MKSVFKKLVIYILTLEARLLLLRIKPKIVAVTGSVGKTSVKDAVYSALKNTHRVRKSEKSFNSEIGVPLSILGLPNGYTSIFQWSKIIVDGLLRALHPPFYPQVLVLEMGVDRPGDMAALTKWIKPDVVVLTRLPSVPVHVEYFLSPDAVVEEKMVLVDALKTDGVLVFNNDDELVRKKSAEILQPSIGYGRYSEAPFRVTGDEVLYADGAPRGMSFTLAHLREEVTVQVAGALGVQHCYTYAAAAAVASVFGVDLKTVQHALLDHEPPPGRMRIIDGIKGSVLIDDTYNSSPVAAERSLMTLREVQGVNRRIAVLGDMLELGRYSVREHERLGEQAVECTDLLITIGVRARKIAHGALHHGMSEKNILQYDDPVRAGKELQAILEKNDLVLIKGSQGVRMERTVEEVMAEPRRAEELLVRQSPFWKQSRF